MPANTVLLITDDEPDARVLKETLAMARDGPFLVEWNRRLAEGLARLRQGGIDVVLLDLFLPDSAGAATFDALFKQVPQIPVMVLSDAQNETVASDAVKRGAQGFLSKGFFEHALIPQALRSIIQRKKVEEALYVEKERARVTLESIGDGVLSTDVACNITYLNKEAERMTGWSRDEACGRPIAEVFRLIDGDTREPARNPVEMVIERRKSLALHAMSVLVRRDGFESPIEDSAAPIFDRHGEVTGAVVTFHDVSEAKAMAQKMEHLAQHDYLTGLPNRMLLHDRLQQAMAYAHRHGTQVAVLFLDLDNFKHINDSLGHSVGDKLLESVADRLVAQVRHSDTVSRQGGDEFVVLVLEDIHAERTTIIGEKILRTLSSPHHIAGNELHITTSIGISLYPSDGADGETLLKNADTAMYHAKSKGKNNYQFFNHEMNAIAVERQTTEAELRHAIDREEFTLHYQPKIDLRTGLVSGVEALLRWMHPVRGMVLPDSFIAVAEDAGLMVRIGRMVLHQACAQAKAWLDLGLPPLSVAVNVSTMEFRDRHFLDSVRDVLKETGLEPRFLELELTETVLMRNVESSSAILRALKEIGVQLAVDDFGTGYSSLSYLSRFPVDVLKIDQSFVQTIAGNDGDSVIVSAVIGMGASLKQRVIAEGVETQEQLRFLHAHHCNEGQGHLFSPPVSADALEAIIRARAAHPGAAIH